MFFFFPIRDEYRVKRFPVVVACLIALNVAVYLASNFRPDYRSVVERFGFVASAPSFRTAVTSQFLHGGLLHLGFNMWYLWLLGDNIEDRWGPVAFLLFYLGTGVFAAFLYSVLIPARHAGIPMIGASGAIAGILGAYSVLFPRSRITFRYFVFFILFFRAGEFEIFAFLWLAFWFLQQAVSALLVRQELALSSTAFAAHFAGFVFGLVLAAGARALRGARHRENVHSGANALLALLGPDAGREGRAEMDPAARREIMGILDEDRVAAADMYEKTLGDCPDAALPEAAQFAVAESFERRGRKESAERAYRNFICAYPLSRMADDALLAFGKLRLEAGDIEKAKLAFLQIVLFYPYGDRYEEAKHMLERKLPEMIFGGAVPGPGSGGTPE